jgi:hypothetical protein
MCFGCALLYFYVADKRCTMAATLNITYGAILTLSYDAERSGFLLRPNSFFQQFTPQYDHEGVVFFQNKLDRRLPRLILHGGRCIESGKLDIGSGPSLGFVKLL